jgi:hypothetical protein
MDPIEVVYIVSLTGIIVQIKIDVGLCSAFRFASGSIDGSQGESWPNQCFAERW